MSSKPDIVSTTLIRAGATDDARVDLSLIDLFEYPIPIDVAYVFKRAVPVAQLEASLRQTLSHYPELLGRLRGDGGGLYVDCNDAGARFVSARSDVRVADLSEEELAELRVAPFFAKNKWLRIKDRDVPLLCVQYTETACGGMILGVQAAHCLIDGESMVELMRNWARVHAGEPVKLEPMRRDGYDSLFDADTAVQDAPDSVPAFKRMSRLTLYWKVIKLAWDSRSTRSVVLPFSTAELKNMRTEARKHAGAVSASTALLGHLWQVFGDLRPNKDADRCGLFMVTGTRHLREGGVPRGYWGNAVWHVRADTTYGELRTAPLGNIAECARLAQTELCYADVRQGMRWLRNEHEAGNLMFGVVPNYELMRRDFFATNMFMLRMYGPDFGTGKAAWVTTKAPPVRWMIRLFPRPSGHGITVHCTVPKSWLKRLASQDIQQRLHRYEDA